MTSKNKTTRLTAASGAVDLTTAPLLSGPLGGDGPILVSGATGYLGRHVLQALSEQHPGRRVLALVRNKADWTRLDWTAQLTQVEPLEGGVTGSDNWLQDKRLTGLCGILHLAAIVQHSRRNTAELYETNIDGTLRMVQLAGKHKCRMVFVSSTGTVGCFKTPAHYADETAPYIDRTVSRWPYYDSKIKAERKARSLAARLGVQLTIVRPPILLGPGDHRFRSTGHVLRYLKRGYPFVLDGGISFCDIRDAAPAMVAALFHPLARPVYHLPGTDCSIAEFFAMMQQVSGVEPPTQRVPYQMLWTLADTAERLAHAAGQHSPLPNPVVVEMAHCWWSVRSLYAKEELGYETRSPRQTLLDTVVWLRANHPDLVAKAA
jgi:dihydroflavonol-4-reductase